MCPSVDRHRVPSPTAVRAIRPSKHYPYLKGCHLSSCDGGPNTAPQSQRPPIPACSIRVRAGTSRSDEFRLSRTPYRINEECRLFARGYLPAHTCSHRFGLTVKRRGHPVRLTIDRSIFRKVKTISPFVTSNSQAFTATNPITACLRPLAPQHPGFCNFARPIPTTPGIWKVLSSAPMNHLNVKGFVQISKVPWLLRFFWCSRRASR